LNPVAINPASTGGRGALNIFTFYGKQWVGLDYFIEKAGLRIESDKLRKKSAFRIVVCRLIVLSLKLPLTA